MLTRLRNSSWTDSLGVLVTLAIGAGLITVLFVYLTSLGKLVQP